MQRGRWEGEMCSHRVRPQRNSSEPGRKQGSLSGYSPSVTFSYISWRHSSADSHFINHIISTMTVTSRAFTVTVAVLAGESVKDTYVMVV